MNLPKLKFIFDRKHIASKTKEGKIDLRITLVKKQKFISTGLSVFPNQWNDVEQQVRSREDAMECNAVLTSMRKKAMKVMMEMMDEGKMDINAVPVMMRQQTISFTFLEYVFQRMERKQVTDHTHKSYVTMYNKLCEFGRIKTFADITATNIRNFSEWLHAYVRIEKDNYGNDVKKKYTQATIYKITSNLSIFISDAVMDGLISENPYITKRMNENKGGTRIDQYLTIEEVGKIEQADMPTTAVSRSRDLFLLQCYTGLAYIDLMTFDFTQYKDGKGQLLCHGKRHKTGTEFVFVLTEKARNILQRYNYKMPVLTNQKYNAHLKIMGDAASIEKPITSHMGRRTAGSIWLNSGIPVDVVAKCLGHQSIQVTQRAYARILDTTVSEAFEKAKGLLEK